MSEAVDHREDPIEETVLRSLRRITRAIDLYSKKLAHRYELTGPQLVCLRELGRIQPATLRELAEEVSLSQGTVSGIVERLRKRGLVSRERSDHDRRRLVLRLTEKGRELAACAPSPLQERLATRLSRLPVAEQTQIASTLQKVVELMEATDLDAAPLLATGPLTSSVDDLAEFLGEKGDGAPPPSPAPAQP